MLVAEEKTGTATLSATAGSARAERQIFFSVPDKALLTLSVRDTDGQPIADAALKYDKTLARSDRYGCLQAEIEQAGQRQLHLVRRGYEPFSFALDPAIGSLTIKNVVLQPIDAGVFLDRVIMLDPDGNNPVAIPVLKKLKDKIEHAGGRALLTWRDGPAPLYRERVMRASAEAADVFLCVNAEGRRCSAGHYHRSAPGRALAQLLQETFTAQDLTGWRKCAIRYSTHEAVLHTAMPAVELSVPRKLAAKKPEPAAQAIYEALRQWFSEGSTQTQQRTVRFPK